MPMAQFENIKMSNNELIEQIKNPQTPLRDKIPLILDLAEQRNREIYPLILAALDSAEYAKVRGTLIYALANYPAEPLFEKAISWLINGNFEMAHEATGILDKIEKNRRCTRRKSICRPRYRVGQSCQRNMARWSVGRSAGNV